LNLGWSKSKDYWRKVAARIEAQKEQIRIQQKKVAEIEEALEYPGEGPWRNRPYYEFVNSGPPAHYEPGPEPRYELDDDEPHQPIRRCARGVYRPKLSDPRYARRVYRLELAEGERKGMRRGIPRRPGKFQGIDGRPLKPNRDEVNRDAPVVFVPDPTRHDFHHPQDSSNKTFGYPNFSEQNWEPASADALGLNEAKGAWRQLDVMIDADDWRNMNVGIMPHVSPQFEPLLQPQRRGRKSIGERAMTSTERSRKHRNKTNKEAAE
jgi:hypothetical protein